MIALRYLGQGRATSGAYEWNGHGDIQNVAIEAAASLLFLRRQEGGCCGGPRRDAGPLFEEISDNTADDEHEE